MGREGNDLFEVAGDGEGVVPESEIAGDGAAVLPDHREARTT